MSVDSLKNIQFKGIDNSLPTVVVTLEGAKIVKVETNTSESLASPKSLKPDFQEMIRNDYRNEAVKPLIGNLVVIQLEPPEPTFFKQDMPLFKEKVIVDKPINFPQSHDPTPVRESLPPPLVEQVPEAQPQLQEQAEEVILEEPNPVQAEEVIEAEQVQEEIEVAEQTAAAPEEVPENVLEELSFLSHGTTAHTEQEHSPQSSRSAYANKNAMESEAQKGTKTPEKMHPALSEQSGPFAASAAMKRHMNGDLRSGPQEKMQDPSFMKADPRLAATIRDKNAPMEPSAAKNWDMVRAEFKQLLQLSLKNSESLLNGKSSGNALSTAAQGSAASNFKNTAFLNSSRQSTSSPDFAGIANKPKADAFALGLKLLQMCMGKQLDERHAATGKTIREEVISGRIPLSSSIPKDLKEILTGLLIGKPGPLTIDVAMRMLALSKEIQTAQGLPQALFYSPSQAIAGKPSQHSHAITTIAAIPGSTLLLSDSPINQENSTEDEEEEEGEKPLIRAVVFGSAEIASDAELFIKELRENKIKVALLTTEANSNKSYDLTAVLKRVECDKPNWKTQLFLAEKLNVLTEETLFIAKDAKQAAGAKALGFEVIEYQSLSQLKQEWIKILGQKEH